MFVAGARLGLERAEVELLEREQADLVGLVLGQEGFVADHVEVAVEELRAGRALPARRAWPGRVRAAPPCPYCRRRCRSRRPLQLEMAIVGIAGAHADLVDQAAAGIDFGAQRRSGSGRCRAAAPPVLGRVRVAIADRHAVEAVIMAVGDAEIAGVGDEAAPAPAVQVLAARIGQGALASRHWRRSRSALRRSPGSGGQQAVASASLRARCGVSA